MRSLRARLNPYDRSFYNSALVARLQMGRAGNRACIRHNDGLDGAAGVEPVPMSCRLLVIRGIEMEILVMIALPYFPGTKIARPSPAKSWATCQGISWNR